MADKSFNQFTEVTNAGEDDWIIGYKNAGGEEIRAQLKNLLFELKKNKTGTINASSTTTQYPTAKAVHDALEVIRTSLAGKQTILGFTPENAAKKSTSITWASTHDQYVSAKSVYDIYVTLQELIQKYSTRVLLGVVSTANTQIETLDYPFDVWFELKLTGTEQYRKLIFTADYEGSETLTKLTNTTANTIYVDLFPITGHPICMNENILADGFLEIAPGASAEISWFLSNGVIELMVASNRITVY
jgi:hypothetical protein